MTGNSEVAFRGKAFRRGSEGYTERPTGRRGPEFEQVRSVRRTASRYAIFLA